MNPVGSRAVAHRSRAYLGIAARGWLLVTLVSGQTVLLASERTIPAMVGADLLNCVWWGNWLLLDHVPAIGGRVLECCAGDRSIAAVLNSEGGLSVRNDLDPGRLTDAHGDASTATFWRSLDPVDWVITNPPYRGDLCLPIVRLAVGACARGRRDDAASVVQGTDGDGHTSATTQEWDPGAGRVLRAVPWLDGLSAF